MKMGDKHALVNMLLALRYYIRTLPEQDHSKFKEAHENAKEIADTAIRFAQEVI